MDDNPQNIEGTWGDLASGKYPISEMFRRTGEHMKATMKSAVNDPIGTVLPLARPLGAVLKEIPAFTSDLAPRDKGAAGNSYFASNNPKVDLPWPSTVTPGRRYVNETDRFLHSTMQLYIPRRDQTWEPALPPGI